ncbi:MAG: hypothetical protein ACREQY_03215, partial [Candidatus Binatia bacterium]
TKLRHEIAELKSRLLERLPRPVPDKPRSNPDDEAPPSRIADGSLQTLAAAVVSLVAGWFLGLLFARRRTRSQRSRLRF